MTRISVSCSSRWVAKLCRNVCGDTRFLIPAASAAAWTARLSWRVHSGSTGLLPGNSQPRGSNTPSRRPSRHQARSSSSSCGDSMAWRSLRPLPRSTRSSMRSESTSPTLSATTSETRSPAPPACAGAGSGGGECRLVLRSRRPLQQKRHRLDAEYRRQPSRPVHHGEPPGKVRTVERHAKEEAQGRNRAVDARRLHPTLCLMQLEAAQIFCHRRVGRAADERRECPHVANVVVARLLAEAAHRHILDHAHTQRGYRPEGNRGGHRGSSRAEGCWTLDARDRMPRSSPLTVHQLTDTADNARRTESRESGFVPCPQSGRRMRQANGCIEPYGDGREDIGGSI